MCGFGVALKHLTAQLDCDTAHGIEIVPGLAQFAQRVVKDGAVVFPGDYRGKNAMLASKYDLIFCEPPLHEPSEMSYQRSGTARDDVLLLNEHSLRWSMHNLAEGGKAYFVMPESFLVDKRRDARRICIEDSGGAIVACLYLGSELVMDARPYRYLVVVEKGTSEKPIFIGELNEVDETNYALITNFHSGKSGTLDEGQFVEADAFIGVPQLRAYNEVIAGTEQPNLKFRKLKTFAERQPFHIRQRKKAVSSESNLLFVPKGSPRSAKSKQAARKSRTENHALCVDPRVASSEYLDAWLNTHSGKSFLESACYGDTARRLSLKSLLERELPVPSLEHQARVLEAASSLREAQAYLDELQQQLWEPSGVSEEAMNRIDAIRLEDGLEHWVDTLPYPLASILARYLGDSHDMAIKKQSLLQFFEATAQFLATIHLSAFAREKGLIEPHLAKVRRALGRGNVSLMHASFGAWKIILQYFAKQSRGLHKLDNLRWSGLYSASDRNVLRILADLRVIEAIEQANRVRNDYLGHSGATNAQTDQVAVEQLEKILLLVRQSWGRHWKRYRLIAAERNVFANNVFKNEVRLLQGRNAAFSAFAVPTTQPLDSNALYLAGEGEQTALRLIETIRMEDSDSGPRSVCFFYSKLVNKQARYVSYHFARRNESFAVSDAMESWVEKLASLPPEEAGDAVSGHE